jgi:hypothetical protein
MNGNKLRQSWTAGLIGLLLTAVPGTAQAASAHVKFLNDTEDSLRVEILYSAANPGSYGASEVHKAKTIRAGGRHEFEFSSNDANCNDKQRKFVITKSSDGSRLGDGEFTFEGKKVMVSTGRNMQKVCRLQFNGTQANDQSAEYVLGYQEAGDEDKNRTEVRISAE